MLPYQVLVSISLYLCSSIISDVQSSAVKNVTGVDRSADFESLTKIRSLFVDKTPLLETLFGEPSDERRIISITTPRGFGRTTNLDMIRRFAGIETDNRGTRLNKLNRSSYHIFGPNAEPVLAISRNGRLIREHCGAYPVVYLDLSGVTAPSLRQTTANLHNRVKQSYQGYEWLEEEKLRMSQRTKDILKHKKHRNDWQFVNKLLTKQVNVVDIHTGICKLMEMLVEQFQRKVILLIDNYDAPLMDAVYHRANTSVDEFYEFFNLFFGTTLDDSANNTELVILTGTHPVSIKIRSEIDFYSFLSEHDLGQFFGFTDAELQRLMALNPGSVPLQELRNHFGGYLSNGSSTPLYNPRSVYRYLESIGTNNRSEISAILLYDPHIEKLVKKFTPNVTWDQDKGIQGFWGDGSFEIISRFEIDQLERMANVLSGCENVTNRDLDIYFSILFVNGYFSHPNDTAPDVIAFPNLQVMTAFQRYLN